MAPPIWIEILHGSYPDRHEMRQVYNGGEIIRCVLDSYGEGISMWRSEVSAFADDNGGICIIIAGRTEYRV